MRILKILLSLFIALVLSVIVRAQTKHATVEAIEAAYINAAYNGQFSKNLSPYIHPDLRDYSTKSWLLQNKPPVAASTIIEATAIRPVHAGELAGFQNNHQTYVLPSHVIEFKMTQTEGDTKSTWIWPLFLKQTAKGWYIVFGIPKSQDARDAILAKQQLVYYYNDNDLWYHNWELRLERGVPYRYTLQLKDLQSGEILYTFLRADKADFYEKVWRIGFRLHPQDRAKPYEQTPSQQGLSLPYVYQVGPTSVVDATDLPLDTLTWFEPITELEFADDRLILARVNGINAGTKRVLAIELIRTPQ